MIAEAGVNHNGSLQTAKELVREAKNAGAQSVKFQSFTARDLVLPKTEKVRYQRKHNPSSNDQFEMLKSLELPKDSFRELFLFGEELGIEVFSTPYSVEELDFLLSVGVRSLKIASADIVDLELVRAAAESKVPTILSTGMSTMEEVENAVNTFEKPETQLTLLHTTSSYPTSVKDLNLLSIPAMKAHFGIKVGFSDHSLGFLAGQLAVAMGVDTIERHLTLNRQSEGPDHEASLDPEEFKSYLEALEMSRLALGTWKKAPAESEMEMRRLARKFIVTKEKMEKGDLLSRDKVTLMRAGRGFPAQQLPSIIGKKLRVHKNKLEPIEEGDV